jgi:hypothetical protein
LPACPSGGFELHALDDGAVTWVVRDGMPRTASGLVPAPEASGECSASDWGDGSILRGTGDASADQVTPIHSTLSCSDGPDGGFRFVISALGDIRDWSVGTFTLLAPPLSVQLEVTGALAPGCGITYLDGVALTIAVETATGGPAPFPQMVTSDFVRTFRVDFDSSSVPHTSMPDTCDNPLTAHVSLHFTQTAADYIYLSGNPCRCE